MSTWGLRTTVLALATVTCGCANIPALDTPSPFTVRDIVDQIQCEVATAAERYSRFKTERWIAVADLTLQVDDSVDLSPKVSVIHPFAVEGTSFTFGAGGQLKRARQRIYTETLELPVRKAKKSFCNTVKDAFDLTGDLGIVDTVKLGFSSYDRKDSVAFPISAEKKPAFGETIQFVLTKNVSGVGPTWTLIHFVGPGGFFGAERVDTHKLIISFAQVPEEVVAPAVKGQPTTVPSVGSTGRAGAINRAYELNQKMLLQSLPAFRQSR